MTSSAAMGIMAAALICFMLITALPQPFRAFFMLIIHCCIGIAAIFVLNVFFAPIELNVGINPFTAAISGILGIPGIALLYGLAYIL